MKRPNALPSSTLTVLRCFKQGTNYGLDSEGLYPAWESERIGAQEETILNNLAKVEEPSRMVEDVRNCSK